MRRALAIALALGLAGAACGDGDSNSDAAIDGPPTADARVDAAVPLNFTTFVIDLVQNQTADNTDPVPYSAFSDLTDPDLDNPAAYAPLFP